MASDKASDVKDVTAEPNSCWLCGGKDKTVRPWISRPVTENLGCHFGVETFNRTDACWSEWHNKDATRYATNDPSEFPDPNRNPTAGVPLRVLFVRIAADQTLHDIIQEYAGREGRMASEMAEEVVATLRTLADGGEVSEARMKEAKKLLEFVSMGTLEYVQRLQGPVVF
jgi:hypothetical protein